MPVCCDLCAVHRSVRQFHLNEQFKIIEGTAIKKFKKFKKFKKIEKIQKLMMTKMKKNGRRKKWRKNEKK